ncbi:MAG: hypothetical protein FWD01_05140, partial [Defluviitaleaceae bacterium]|nr:hypothetical protein [Defluviitaleaceae bacterium]
MRVKRKFAVCFMALLCAFTAIPTNNILASPFTVTIIGGGSGSDVGGGSHQNEGALVNINAGSRNGFIFSHWTVNSGNISLNNYSSSYTSFTMPNTNVTLTANWTPSNNTSGQFSAIVNGSFASNSGTGNYTPNTTVNIDAGTRSGFYFSGWTVSPSNAVNLANPSSPSTSFTMPNSDVTLTANWTPSNNTSGQFSAIVNGSFASNSGTGNYTPNTTVNINAGT